MLNMLSRNRSPDKRPSAPGIDPTQAGQPRSATHDALEMRVKERTAELETQIIERHKAEERLRELTTRILQLQDEERRRIARDLHDSAGQYLAAIQMNLVALEQPTSTLTDWQAKRISDCHDMVNRCTSEIRTLSYLLHPPLLDDMGLASAIRSYAEGFAERSDIRVELDIPKNFERLPIEIETALFRVVQQSLANIHRHSGSCVAKISLRQDAERVTAVIADEGCGIAPEILKQFDTGGRLLGVGIAGMRERIRVMKGHFNIRSDPEGTTIEVSLPITQRAEGNEQAHPDAVLAPLSRT
ncbi:MAG: sensor histidine kinase [Candidatus Acidiferrales bacterium]